MGQIDQALHAAPVGSPEQQRFAVLAEEVQHLRDIVRKLLLLARADRGALRPDFQSCDLARLARECLDDVAAGTPGIDFSSAGETSLPVDGDPSLLRPILLNLLANAAKYNRPGGSVRLHLARDVRAGEPWVSLTFTNTGAALPPENVAHVFDRFFRADTVRTAASGDSRGGLGLGLSLAREFARAHGGDLILASNAPDAISFRLDLPVTRARPA
jgi:signal transduction histidine kinase